MDELSLIVKRSWEWLNVMVSLNTIIDQLILVNIGAKSDVALVTSFKKW